MFYWSGTDWKKLEIDISHDIDKRPMTVKNKFAIPKTPEVLTSLSNVIQILNQKYMGDIKISDADIITVEEWIKSLENDNDLRELARTNKVEDFRLTFEVKLRQQMTNSLSEHNRYFISMIFADRNIQNRIFSASTDIYYKWARTDLPPITPGTPAENRSIFRRAIRRCKGFLYWLDSYVEREGLEFLLDSADLQNVKEIRILTSLYGNYQINEGLYNYFNRSQKEMKSKGISLEMRLLSTKDAHNRAAHDRFIIGENIIFNVPSFTTITKGRFSEIKETTNKIPFQDYWNDHDSLDVLKDLSKIKYLLDRTKIMFNAVCSNCKREIQVPFKPDGRRPVYCIDCRKIIK